MAPAEPIDDCEEELRRNPGADGVLVRLSDGAYWLLAYPTIHAGRASMSRRELEACWDRLYDSSVLDQAVRLDDVWTVARDLLRANYTLTDAELGDLLSLPAGFSAQEFARVVLEILFGQPAASRTYLDWVRASLNANGLSGAEISARDLPGVLSILTATHRTIPQESYVSSHITTQERMSLDGLV